MEFQGLALTAQGSYLLPHGRFALGRGAHAEPGAPRRGKSQLSGLRRVRVRGK